MWNSGAWDSLKGLGGDQYVKALWFAEISSGTTSGTITKPAGGGSDVSFIMDEWGSDTDALVSKMANGKPTFESPVTAGGVTVTTTFNTSGVFAFSGTPSPAGSHAVVFVYTCQLKNLLVTETLFESELASSVGAVLKTDYDATTFLYATLDDTPQPKTPAQVMAILSAQAAATFSLNSQILSACGGIVLSEDAIIGPVGGPTLTFDGSGGILGVIGNISLAALATIDGRDPSADWAAYAAGLTTQILVGGGAGVQPVWGTAIPTAVTIGTKYIYRAAGTDVPVADGGTGASTLTDHGVLLGSGTIAITPMAVLAAGELIVGVAGADPHALAAGAITTILVGGGAADPVWTTATGTGAPVRENTPTLITPVLGAATGTSIDLGTTTLLGSRSITVDTGGVFNIDIGSAAGDDFTVDTNKFMVEGDTGCVGIGTATPIGLLHVYKDGAQINLEHPSNNSYTQIRAYEGGSLRGTINFMGSAYPAARTNNLEIDQRNGGHVVLQTLGTGNVGIGTVSPTAALHLKAGTATALTAPLKLTSGPLLTAKEPGAWGFLTDDLYFTITTGSAEKGIVLNDGANLTRGKIPVAGINGRLMDGQTPLAGTKVYYVADSSGGAVTRKLTFIDGILTAET